MKTINEMRETVKKFMIENGFNQDEYLKDGDNYYLPGKMEIVKKMEYNSFMDKEVERTYYEGRCIRVTELHRSNGTDTNQSIQIAVMDYHGSSGRMVHREKLYSRHGEKKTASVLADVLEAYNN